MNGITQTMHHPARGSAFKWIASGSVMEAVVSVAIIALSIVGLAGVNPLMLAAIATILAGAAVLIEGGAFQMAGALTQRTTESGQANAGMSASFLGALCGIILGILALMNVSPLTLLSIAVLAFGVTFLLSGMGPNDKAGFAGPADGFLLLGLSVAILGLLAVIGLSPATLVLVGLLILGAASLISGSFKGFQAAHRSETLNG
jgi:hypothetical protein